MAETNAECSPSRDQAEGPPGGRGQRADRGPVAGSRSKLSGLGHVRPCGVQRRGPQENMRYPQIKSQPGRVYDGQAIPLPRGSPEPRSSCAVVTKLRRGGRLPGTPSPSASTE